MKYLRSPLLALIAMALTSLAIHADVYAQQPPATALERGFRTGYSDGYNSGFRDAADKAARDYQNKEEYQRGDRSYNQAWGTLDDYRDGYQQGFEVGYNAGFEQQPFDSTIPSGISRRGATNPQVNSGSVSDDTQPISSSTQTNQAPLYIPQNSVLTIELESRLSSDVSHQGDRFQARVIQQREFEGAIVEGHVTQVKRAGKVKGTAELQLAFDTLRMPDGRTTPIKAVVVEIVDMGYGNSPRVDDEGGVKGKDTTKDDVTKVGASTGIGAIIGAIVGGGKGAAIGAAIGGAAGTSTVLSQRGKDLRLERGQQLKIRTATDTRVQ